MFAIGNQGFSDQQIKSKQMTEELLKKDSINTVNITKFKEDFVRDQRKRVISRRSWERIKTVQDYIVECERQFLINPDGRQGLKYLRLIVDFIWNSEDSSILGDKYYNKVIAFSNSLEPSEHQSSSGQPKLMEAKVREKLISSLQSPGSGQDWEHFLLGLGRDRQEADLIRLRQGDIDSLERQNRFNIRDILSDAITMFERNCQTNNVSINMTNHVIDVLKDRTVMFSPYDRLARQLNDLNSS